MNDQKKMTLSEFEERLPEFFSTGTGSISGDPRLQTFLTENPDSAALVRDLQYIAEEARRFLQPEDVEPSEDVWKNIVSNLKSETAEADDQETHEDQGTSEESEPSGKKK